MTRKKTSIIWTMQSDQFCELVKNSTSLGQILLHFGLTYTGSNSRTLKNRIKQESIDISHIKLGINSNKGRKFRHKKMAKLSDILTTNSSYDRHRLKKRLVNECNFQYMCSSCGVSDTWNNKPLTLQLEHKNGINNDNRIENLCLLCPNCHSQTDTFSGRNKKHLQKFDTCHCGNKKQSKSKQCFKCNNKSDKLSQRKVIWPTKDELQILISKHSFVQIGKMYGVSDNAVRKWCKTYELPYKKKDIIKLKQ